MSDLNAIDTSKLETIASATSQRPHRDRWTTLTIWWRPEGEGGRRPFLAEIFGGSRIRGEVPRHRRRQYGSLQDALDFFDDSLLKDQVKEQARAWLAQHGARIVRGTAEREQRTIEPLGFMGARGLEGAIAWLYPDGDDRSEPWTQEARLAQFAHDFGVPARTVRHTLKGQKEGKELPSWANAFFVSLMFFDRVRFHEASGRPAGSVA